MNQCPKCGNFIGERAKKEGRCLQCGYEFKKNPSKNEDDKDKTIPRISPILIAIGCFVIVIGTLINIKLFMEPLLAVYAFLSEIGVCAIGFVLIGLAKIIEILSDIRDRME